jgi:hypothetical protein
VISGIAASNYSHVGYFPSRAAYDDFYSIALRVVDIARTPFAEYVQQLLVQYLAAKVSGQTSAWYDQFWTGAKGRYCLCHATHGGTNNNMGIEVDWRDIKKICPPSASLATFLGTLFHFVKSLGEEHEEFLENQGTPNSFVCEPVMHKLIWDELQDVHPKTLVCSFVIRKNRDLVREFVDRVEEIYSLCDPRTPLHLKIEAWHSNARHSPLSWTGSCSVMMPRQHILKSIDPYNTKTPHEVMVQLRPVMSDFHEQVLLGKHKQGVEVHQALDLYESFHHLTYESTWGQLPWPCTCPTSHAHCACKHAGLLAALSDPTVKVPSDFVAAEPADCKKCKRMKGTAGPKRMRILAELSQEKQKSQSKIPFLEMEGSGSKSIPTVVPEVENAVVPEVEMPTSSDDDFTEVLCKL